MTYSSLSFVARPSSLVALAAALFASAACASGDAERTDPAGLGFTSSPFGSSPAGSPSSTGAAAATSSPPIPTGPTSLGTGVQSGMGMSSNKYAESNVSRNGIYYVLIGNGWGPGFQNQSISWSGTSFTILEMNGEQGPNYEPAGYPAVFCGFYSNKQSKTCGLPATFDSLASVRTGWRWNPNGNDGEYNAAYDIWVGDKATGDFKGYLMVWLRDPPGQQPAGSLQDSGVTVPNLPGTWNVWTGMVNNAPIINWVKQEGQDLYELEFDLMDFVRDAPTRGFQVPGTYLQSVAVGFEIWNGPVTNLVSEDFYVEVTTQ